MYSYQDVKVCIFQSSSLKIAYNPSYVCKTHMSRLRSSVFRVWFALLRVFLCFMRDWLIVQINPQSDFSFHHRDWLQSQWSIMDMLTAWSTMQGVVSLTFPSSLHQMSWWRCFTWKVFSWSPYLSPLQTPLTNPLMTPQQKSSGICWIWTSSATSWLQK